MPERNDKNRKIKTDPNLVTSHAYLTGVIGEEHFVEDLCGFVLNGIHFNKMGWITTSSRAVEKKTKHYTHTCNHISTSFHVFL